MVGDGHGIEAGGGRGRHQFGRRVRPVGTGRVSMQVDNHPDSLADIATTAKSVMGRRDLGQ
ncbi:hypothetical protein GCM10018954_090090 [Kutzneria kofuensis]